MFVTEKSQEMQDIKIGRDYIKELEDIQLQLDEELPILDDESWEICEEITKKLQKEIERVTKILHKKEMNYL